MVSVRGWHVNLLPAEPPKESSLLYRSSLTFDVLGLEMKPSFHRERIFDNDGPVLAIFSHTQRDIWVHKGCRVASTAESALAQASKS